MKTTYKIFYILAKILSYPFILSIILIKYNLHAILNSILFLIYGGEWITYAKEDKVTMLDIYKQLKKNQNGNN